jgi:hypothetical protein
MKTNRYVGTFTVNIKKSLWRRIVMCYEVIFHKNLTFEFYFDELAEALLRAKDQGKESLN